MRGYFGLTADSILGIIGSTVPEWLQRADMMFIDVEDPTSDDAVDRLASQLDAVPPNVKYIILSFRAQSILLAMVQQTILWEEQMKADAVAAPEEIRGLLLSAIQMDLSSAYASRAALQRANDEALRLGLPVAEEVDEEEAKRVLTGLEILIVIGAVAVAVVISIIAVKEAFGFFDKSLTKFQLIQAGKQTGNWQPVKDALTSEVEAAKAGFPWGYLIGGVGLLAVGGLAYSWWKGYLGRAGEALVTAQSYRRR